MGRCTVLVGWEGAWPIYRGFVATLGYLVYWRNFGSQPSQNSWVHALIAIPRTSGLQACMHPPKGKRKENEKREKERERGAPKTKETTNSTLPPK